MISEIILAGFVGVCLLVMMGRTSPVLAIGPTPTPVPDSVSCRLEQGANCKLERLDITAGSLITKIHPPLDAQEVPTYTLVSVTFGWALAAETINDNTFYVRQGLSKVAGRVEYIGAANIVIFYPDTPLLPDTYYTATVTTDIQDAAGNPLSQNMVWSFKTFIGPVQLNADLSSTDVPLEGGMSIYFGDVHSHSGYDDSDPDHDYLTGTPAQAFNVGQANGLEFMALTGHDRWLNATRWQDILDQANAATSPGFVGLRGFEFQHPDGHLTVLETDTFEHWTSYDTVIDFYVWLLAQPNAIAEFNHPEADVNFYDFLYHAPTDHKIVLREVLDTEQALLSLNKGWHVGTLLNSDTHTGNWGSQKFMGVVATGLTRPEILDALRARRTFYVSPYGQRMAVVMQANGAWMGSAIPDTGVVNIKVTVYDPDHGGKPLNLRVYDNGVRVARARLSGTSLRNWSIQLPSKLGHYYYAEAYHDGWIFPAYSSPVWVEQVPVANAGDSQFAPPGGTVELDGTRSRDPDGDALVYQWTQPGTLTGSFDRDDAARPIFTAPGTLGTVALGLTVTDPGGLSDDDTTEVVVTDKPILSIVANGPRETAPGALITYTLTVTNTGINPATQVVINNDLPTGSSYVSGGTLLSSNVVSWTLATLPPNGGVAQVEYTVSAAAGLINDTYSATCAEGMSVTGTVPVLTNIKILYLPILTKESLH